MESNQQSTEHFHDLSHLRRTTLMSSALTVFQKTTKQAVDPSSKCSNRAIKIYIRLMFLRIGEIDTLNEKYQAQATIESRWAVGLEKVYSLLTIDEQRRLTHGKSVSLIKYSELNWHPQLYIENALGDLKEQIRYTVKTSRIDHQIYICEHRDIKGLFWEKLELQHFPSDVQDLSISIASSLYDDKVLLVVDPHHTSGVNREAFVDQQEWSLYEHVDTQPRYIKEFLFRTEDEDEECDQDDNSSTFTNRERKRAVFTVTCHAARRSNYFFWNGYCLILLITVVSFCIFAIPPNLAANRLQISCTLLLTSITFRWTVNRSLPTISYLTTMDKYAIMCLFILVILSIWHAIIGALIFYYIPDSRVTPTTWFVSLDRYVLYLSVGIYLLIHVFLFVWLFRVPLKYRRELKKKDLQYRQILSKDDQPVHLTTRKKLRRTGTYIPISITS